MGSQWQVRTVLPHLTLTENDAIQLEDTVWEDIRVPATSLKANAAVKVPSWTKFKDNGAGSQGVYLWHFASGSEQELHFTLQVPHNYKLGTDLHGHTHWSPTSVDTGNVIWGLEYTFVDINGTFGNTTLITATQAGSGTSGKHQLAAWSAISGAGISGVSSMMVCRIYRDAGSDTYADEAALLEVDFHYQIDSMGSREETSK